MEQSDPISVCTGCKRKLIWPRKKYEWDLARGFSPKDAAARALYAPGTIKSARSCCVVNLQTNFDSTKDLIDSAGLDYRLKAREYEDIKKDILTAISDKYFTKEIRDVIVSKIEELIQKALKGEPFFKVKAELFQIMENLNVEPNVRDYLVNLLREKLNKVPEREIVKIYVANDDNTIGGQFLLEDIAVDRLSDLAARFPEPHAETDPRTGQTITKQSAYISGFEVTNISYLPESLMREKKWKEPVLALWSGMAKIIPVISKGGEMRPAKLWLLSSINGVTQFPVLINDPTVIKSLLQSEIINAGNEALYFQNIGVINVEVLTLRKQFSSDIVN